MNRKDNIEELFKSSLEDFKVEPPEKTKKKFLFYLMGWSFFFRYKTPLIAATITLAVASGVWLGLSDSDSTLQTTSNPTIESSKETKEISSGEHTGNTGNADTKTIESEINHPIKESAESVVVNEKYAEKESVEENTDITVQTKKHQQNNKSNSLINKENFESKTGAQSNALNPTSALNTSLASSSSGDESVNTERPKSSDSNSETTVKGEDNNSSVPSNENDVVEILNSNNSGIIESPNTNDTSSVIDEVELSVDSMSFLIDSSLASLDSISHDTLSTEKDSNASVKNKPFLKYYAGLNTTYTSWMNIPGSFFYNPVYAFGIEGRVEYGHFSMNAGINYETQSVFNAYTTEAKGTLFMDSNLVYQYDTLNAIKDSSYISFENTGIKSTKINHDKNGYYNLTLSYVNIPVQLGYHFDLGRHKIGLGLGAGLHILANQQHPQFSSTDIDVVAPKEYLFDPKSLLIDYNASLFYGYKINSRLLVIASLNARQNSASPVQVRLSQQEIDNNLKSLYGIGGSLKLLYKF